MNNTTVADLSAETERLIISELARLVTHEMWGIEHGAADQIRFCVEFDDVAAVVGTRWAYAALLRARFEPSDSGLWFRRRMTSGAEELMDLDLEPIAPRMLRAVKALDPLGLLAAYLPGGQS